MKAIFLVLVSVVLVAAKYEYTDEEMAEYKKHMDECVKETKADADVIAKFDQKKFPDSYKDTNCYYKCLFHKFQFLDDKDEFLIDKIKANIQGGVRAKHWPVFEECLKSKGSDICERAFEAHKCYISHDE